MSQTERVFRPQVDEFEFLGARVEVVDPAGILQAAHADPAPLLHGAAVPPPLRAVSASVAAGTADGLRVHRFTGTVLRSPDEGPARRLPPVNLSSLPSVPPAAAVLLGAALPLAAGLAGYGAQLRDSQFVGAVRSRWEAAAAQSGGPGPAATATGEHAEPADAARPTDAARPAAAADPAVVLDDSRDGTPVTVRDPQSGLTADVRFNSGSASASLTATVPSRDVAPHHLAAFVRLVLEVARRHGGWPTDQAVFAGHTYRLSRYPDGRFSDPDVAEAVRLDQVGGLPEIVRELREVAVSFNHPAAMARWGARRPQGILMYGPPGTGKTTLARALATEIRGTLREIRTPEILDKYVGQSERNIKRIFAAARTYRRPTVLLFDEFDSIISYTGAPTDAASQMVNSVAGIFKQEMNTLVEENPNVIVVATTNFPDRVDDSLIRSGRFDIKMSVPLPDAAARADIFTTILRQLASRHETNGFRMFADDLDVVQLAGLTPGMTGADFKEVLRRAQLGKAMQEARGEAPGPISQVDLRRYIADMHRLA